MYATDSAISHIFSAYTFPAIPTLTSRQTSQTRAVLEKSAVLLSEAITWSLLTTLNNGVALRVWWENRGKALAQEIGWTILRTLGMLILGIACLVCITGFAIAASWGVAKRLYGFSRVAWAWVNLATDDGLGLYGPSAILENWFSPTNLVVVNTTEVEGLSRPLSEPEVLIWAKKRWPQLGA